MVAFRQRRLLENAFNVLAILGFLVFLMRLTIPLLMFAENGLTSNRKISYFKDSLLLKDDGLSNGFVLHRWLHLCEMTSLRDLFKSSLFPSYPDLTDTVNKRLMYFSPNKSVGARISGILNVPESGVYVFKLKSIGMAEFWLEMDGNVGFQRTAKSKVIAQEMQNSNRVYSIDQSNEIFLEEEKPYKFEILNSGEFVQLFWILPGESHFVEIKRRFITHDASSFSHEVLTDLFPKEEDSFENENRVGRYYFVSFIPKWVINSAIAVCSTAMLKSERNSAEIISKPNGVNGISLYEDFDGSKGDLWRNNNEVNTIVSLYMDGLARVYRLKYRTKRLYKMEKLAVSIASQGPLYKMQLEFNVDGLDYKQRVIQYVNQVNSTSICQPAHLKWHRDAVINVIIVLKDQEKTIKRFIDRFARVFEQTLEVDLHLIIVQFGQSAIDIQDDVERTSLIKRYSVVHMIGPYSRSRGLNEGVLLAKGDHAIVLAYDANLDIPDTLFEDTRTNCIPGHIAFSPVFYQLGCTGQAPGRDNQQGYWCYQNYAIIGIYRSDWHRLSGMEVSNSEQKENWNFIEKIRNSGMAVIRHTYPGLYRYHTPYMEHTHNTPKTPMLFKEGFLKSDDN